MAAPNDNFADAIALDGSASSQTVYASTADATVEPGEDITYANGSDGNVGDATVWYSYTAAASGTVTLDTGGDTSDTHLQVFEGGFSEADQIAEGDGYGHSSNPFAYESSATFHAVAGHTYDIQVGTYADDYIYGHGAFSLSDTFTPDTVACYLHGTRIATAEGERAVEALSIGDEVITACGARRPVKWIGRRAFAAALAQGDHLRPVRIAAGALGEGLPIRDLWVSPCHAMLIDDLLVEARFLLNGATITQPAVVGPIEYLHVELDSHDLVLAEGAASETFLDNYTRGRFHNAAEFAVLYPGVRPDPLERQCAERPLNGAKLEAVRARFVAAGSTVADVAA